MELMKKMKKNNKGFTLAELLIVVAIIGVLVAISIPIFTSQLEKSRESTDLANMRAAKAAAVTAYLSEEAPVWTKNATGEVSFTEEVYYDATNGVLKSAKSGITGYGKGTNTDAGNTEMGYAPSTSYAGQIIKVSIDEDSGEITLEWEAAS
jgi:type IV pilus assembly protein PilA